MPEIRTPQYLYFTGNFRRVLLMELPIYWSCLILRQLFFINYLFKAGIPFLINVQRHIKTIGNRFFQRSVVTLVKIGQNFGDIRI